LIRRAISIQPNSADYYAALGNALQSLARYDEAIEIYQRGLAINPNHAEIHNNLGCALRDTKRTNQATAEFRQAIVLRPDYSEALNNLANAMVDAGELQPAIEHLRHSLSLQPNFAETHNSLGAVLERQAQYGQAIDSYRRALTLAPNHFEAHVNLGIALLREGNYPAGWAEYEWRLKRKDALARNALLNGKSPWQGEPLANRTILLQAEQGFGDTIQFARYIPLIAQRGGRVILRCQPKLLRLLRNLPGLHAASAETDALPEFDVHCSLASLPFIFGTTLQTIPNQGPYLHVDESLVQSWASRLTDQSGLKVGLAWAGRAEHLDDRNRSVSLEMLKELLHPPGAKFISLQKGDASAQIAAISESANIVDWTTELHDFADTAALIGALDLIITVDTAVAHLAAALGKPAWVLLPHVPDWRWLLDRSDSPWYPTMQLFRQPGIGDWQTPIAQISQALTEFRRNS
jgi:tetratricopeptide (TPR) repeat protein